MAEEQMNLPTVNLDTFLASPSSPAALRECKAAADALITYGALILHDERVSEQGNQEFLDLLEDYFAQPDEVLQQDERPELAYQVGVTLANTEKPKCAIDEPCLDVIARLAPDQRPLDISGHQPDPKCRFFWRMAEEQKADTEFPGLNAENVVPPTAGIKERWENVMEGRGKAMRASVKGLAQMVAVGLGLDKDVFTDAARYGPHLLAPTASDLTKYGEKDTILAGFHTDLNFLTIHGRSRYPGLNIWARNTGSRIPVSLPPTTSGKGSFLLVQAGKQIEHLTGGLIKAGFHEVTVNEKTVAVMEKRKQEFPDRPLVRISSTMFYHLGSDYVLEPMAGLREQLEAVRRKQKAEGRDEGQEKVYQRMKVGEQVSDELKHIALMAN